MSLFLQSCSIVFPLLKCYIVISLLSSRFCSNKIYNGALCSALVCFSFCPFYIATWTTELGNISGFIPNINQNLRNYRGVKCAFVFFSIIYCCAKIFELVSWHKQRVVQCLSVRCLETHSGRWGAQGAKGPLIHGDILSPFAIWYDIYCLFSNQFEASPAVPSSVLTHLVFLFACIQWSGKWKHLRHITNVIIYSQYQFLLLLTAFNQCGNFSASLKCKKLLQWFKIFQIIKLFLCKGQKWTWFKTAPL